MDSDARSESDDDADPATDQGNAYAVAVPVRPAGSTDVAAELIAAQQVLTLLLEQFGSWQPTGAYWAGVPLVAPDLAQGLRTASFHVTMALASAAGAISEKCNLAAREVEIVVRPGGPNDDLIRRCRHKPPHCWTYTGTKIDCP